MSIQKIGQVCMVRIKKNKKVKRSYLYRYKIGDTIS